MIKKCEICGREFAAQRSTAKYCSNRCRLAAQRGYAYAGELQAPAPNAAMSDDEVLEVIQRARRRLGHVPRLPHDRRPAVPIPEEGREEDGGRAAG